MALYLADRYQALQRDRCGIRTFDHRELEASDRIARHIGRGGLAILEGRWERIVQLLGTLRRRVPAEALPRLMIRAASDTTLGVEPAQTVPGLGALVGRAGAPDQGGEPVDFLVSLPDLLEALAALKQPHYVEALGAGLVVHKPVLVPRAQPLIHLLRRALEAAAPELPPDPTALDMGCGSGVCALLAARVLPGARVIASDLLPEACATARTNIGRLEGAGLIRPGAVTVAPPGDLYQHLPEEKQFDLILFNAPWVAAPVRSREEYALHDPGQQTVRRFLLGARSRLAPGGRVILGYANHSGPGAMAALERFIGEAGLAHRCRHSDRIKTHRSHRAWQAIYAFDLYAGDRAGRHS